MPALRHIPFVAAGCVVIAALLAVASPATAGGYRTVDPPRSLDGIDLSAKGSRIDDAAFAGRWTFLAIGYTHCPDICPTVLSNLAAVRAEMAKKLPSDALPQVMFVSVDPARDTPGWLAGYVANFGKGFVGATAEKPVIDRLVRILGAYYRLGRKDKDGFYTVDHSAEIYLIGPGGRLRARFMPPLDPERTLTDFLALAGIGPRSAAAVR